MTLQHLCCHHLRSLDIANIDISWTKDLCRAIALALDHGGRTAALAPCWPSQTLLIDSS
jgi:hypothetical protein